MYKICPRCQKDKWSFYRQTITAYRYYCSNCHKFSYLMEFEPDGSKTLLSYEILTNLFKISFDFKNNISYIFTNNAEIIGKFLFLIKINEQMLNEDIDNKIKKYIVFS